jgi:hypothetical protein
MSFFVKIHYLDNGVIEFLNFNKYFDLEISQNGGSGQENNGCMGTTFVNFNHCNICTIHRNSFVIASSN